MSEGGSDDFSNDPSEKLRILKDHVARSVSELARSELRGRLPRVWRRSRSLWAMRVGFPWP